MENVLQGIYNVFKLIRLLNTRPEKDVPQLMRLLGTGRSNVYRYLKLLEQLGYQIETNDKHRKSIKISPSDFGKDILNKEELAHLQDILQQSGTQL